MKILICLTRMLALFGLLICNEAMAADEQIPKDIKIDLKSRIPLPSAPGLGLIPEAYRVESKKGDNESRTYYVPLYAYVLREELDRAIDAAKKKVAQTTPPPTQITLNFPLHFGDWNSEIQ